MRNHRSVWAGVVCCGWLALAGCSLPAAETETLEMPNRGIFPKVSNALEGRCATLDCHGGEGRNLRLYSGNGLRLTAGELPGSVETTDEEIEANYRSIVGLEPELMSEVVADGGEEIERLVLMRKALGLEKHAAGAVIVSDDATYRCIRSWLRGTLDDLRCLESAAFGPP